MQKSALEDLYLKHHRRGNRYGYLFCSGARAFFLKKWVGKSKKVLDLGCRDGMLTESFVSGNEVIGVDIDRKALQLCRERLHIETKWLDLNEEWLWQEDVFDCIIACEIIEHLFFLEPFFQNIVKSLKKNGLFIGSVPNSFRMRNRWKFMWGREYETDQTHIRQFSYEKLQKILRRYFFKAEIIPIGGKVLPFLPVSKISSKILGRLFSKDFLWKASF